MIRAPYLLYLGDATDALSVKTSRGLSVWRPELCVGEYRGEGCTVTLGLPHLGFQEAVALGAATLVIGIANRGGLLGLSALGHAVQALEAGLDVAAGLHERLSSHPALRAAAAASRRQLFDVREPPDDLGVGDGRRRPGHRLLTVGTDCSVGKMYTALALERELQSRSIPADFRATGQTGILIAQAGIPIDAVVADFVSGAAERVCPARFDDGWDLVEGQGSLFHPSFAGVSLGLLHGAQPEAIVLCHDVGREHMRGLPGRSLPDLSSCLEANLAAARLTSPTVQAVGIALNTSRLSTQDAARICREVEDQTGLPCQDPIAMGVNKIADRVLSCSVKSIAA